MNKYHSISVFVLTVAAGILLAIIAVVLLYLLSDFCLSRITIEKENISETDIAIYILTNGVHTDIVVPTRSEQMDWSKEVLYSNTILNDTTYQYLAMGWGDKGFYLETPTWSDLKVSVAFKSAFALSTTAIHATYYSIMTESETCRKILVGKEQYLRLVAYIEKSFEKDKDGHFMNIKTDANYGNTDAFYEATGRYSLFHTCNTWANNALKASGQRSCLWTAFDTGIFLQYKK